MTEEIKQWIIFRENSNELHDTYPFKCTSELIYDDNEHSIIHKKVNIKNKNIDLYITCKKEGTTNEWNFVRGFMYKNNKEYVIKTIALFSSLQIGTYCYDKILICDYFSN
jgi:hypothetical protein